LTPDLLELGSGSGRINTITRKTYPLEFKLDAVALARENGAHLAQVARDLGVAKTTLLNWVRKAEKDHIPRPSLSGADMTELRELRRHNKLLEQEAEVMRRAVGYLSREINPK
jgi:transposase